MNVVRIPFRWETLQPEPRKPLRAVEVTRLRDVVDQATKLGLCVLLDPHNYARYFDKVIGSADVPNDVFADFWQRMALEFKDNNHVWFGLVNEPHDMPTEQWVNAANAAIAAIRSVGSTNLILVPGNGWTGTGGWSDTWYGGANSEWMLKITDPKKNYWIEVHCYLDQDSSGSYAEVASETIGVERIAKFTAWCRDHHVKAFLGEVGVASDERSHTALENMLTAMERDSDVWKGFTWWAAGAWWGDYIYTLEPKDNVDRPQMEWLKPHLHGKKPAPKP